MFEQPQRRPYGAPPPAPLPVGDPAGAPAPRAGGGRPRRARPNRLKLVLGLGCLIVTLLCLAEGILLYENLGPPGVGEQTRVGWFALTVTRVHGGIPRYTTREGARGQIVEVDLTLKNLSAEPRTFEPASQTLYAGKRPYRADVEANMLMTLPGLARLKDPIDPGERVTASLAFAISGGDRPTSIVLRNAAEEATVRLR